VLRLVVAVVLAVDECGLVVVALAWSGHLAGGEAGEGLAAPFAGFRRQAGGCAALGFFLPGVPGGEDPLVADDEQGRGEQHEECQAHEAAQPRLMSLLAGSLVVAKPRSAPVRRA